MPFYPNNSAYYQPYASKAFYVSSGAFNSNQTISGSIRQLSRIQSIDWDIAYPIDQVTYVDAGQDAYLNSHNPVNLNLEWYHTDGRNEQALGLIDIVGASGNLALNLDQEKALYLSMENQAGIDAVGSATPNKTVIGFAQGLMTSYEMSCSVGDVIRSRAGVNCLSAFVYTGVSGNLIPGVNYQNGTQITGVFNLPVAQSQYGLFTGAAGPVGAIGARDMFMLFPVGTPFGVVFTGSQSCYLQSFQLGFTFPRHELKPLGCVYPPNRALLYPIQVELNTSAIVSTYQRDQLSRISCLGTGFNAYLIVKQPCSNTTVFGFYLDTLQLQSQSFASSITQDDTVNLRWRGLITSPSTIFFDPFLEQLINLDTSGAWGTQW